jgi:hypothetical protein
MAERRRSVLLADRVLPMTSVMIIISTMTSVMRLPDGRSNDRTVPSGVCASRSG